MTDPQTSYVEAERPPYLLAAVAGALAAATAFTVWNQSVVNEKVYTLSLLSIALVLWLIVRWDDQPAGEAHDHHLLMIVFLLALTSTNHMMGVLVGPAVVVLLFLPLKSQRPTDEAGRNAEWSQWGVFCSVFALIVASGLENVAPLIIAGVLFLLALGYAVVYARNGDFAVAVLLVAIVGVSVYLFLPIRAAHYPPINEGEPTTWKTLWEVLTRQQYGKPPVWERQASLGAQIGMWFQYFSWQWGRDWYDSTSKLFGLVVHWQRTLAVVFFGVGVLGAVRHWVADRRRAIAMTLLMATFTLFLIFYLNFKYGYSWQPEKQLAREVRERDYFFIASFALWGVWVGMGLATLMEWVSDSLEVRVPDAARRWTLATFDSTQAPAIYRGRAWPKPPGKLLSFSDAYVQDSLQPVYWLGEQKTYANLGGVTVTLDPQQLGRQYLERADVIVLQAVKDQLGRRSIYYSRTVGPYADQFGLTGSLEGQGFARKLRPQPLAEADSIKLLPVFGFVNLRRTEALAFGVYHADAAARHRPRGWVDRPSEGILATYGLLYQSLSQALRTTKPEVANRALLLADSVFKNTSYGYIPPADR